MSTAPALLATVLSALRADVETSRRLGRRIWDCAPRDAEFPHLVVEELTVRDRSGEAAPLEEIRLSLRVLSRSGGRSEALAIATRIETVLRDLPPLPPGARLVVIRRESGDCRPLRDRRTIEATLRFLALVEPDDRA